MGHPDPPGQNYPDITTMAKLDYDADVPDNVKNVRKAMRDARIAACALYGVDANQYTHIIRLEPKNPQAGKPLSASCGCGCS